MEKFMRDSNLKNFTIFARETRCMKNQSGDQKTIYTVTSTNSCLEVILITLDMSKTFDKIVLGVWNEVYQHRNNLIVFKRCDFYPCLYSNPTKTPKEIPFTRNSTESNHHTLLSMALRTNGYPNISTDYFWTHKWVFVNFSIMPEIPNQEKDPEWEEIWLM